MEILRTPDERFAGLDGFDFSPHYSEVIDGQDGTRLRIHHLDEGPRDAAPVLLMHGEPSWCYLYRRFIPDLVARGHRVVAPDLVGFGRSDKPARRDDYTYERHVQWMSDWLTQLDLTGITLFCQDWGGLIGLTIPMDMASRFDGLLVMNTMIATGDVPLSPGFVNWRAWNAKNPDMAIGKLMSRGIPHLSPAEAAAYDAPFPDARYKAGVRRFPNLVPEHADDPGAELSRRARAWWQSTGVPHVAMVVGAADPVLGGPVMALLRSWIRGCPEPVVVPDGGHFVQEWSDRFLPQCLVQLGRGE